MPGSARRPCSRRSTGRAAAKAGPRTASAATSRPSSTAARSTSSTSTTPPASCAMRSSTARCGGSETSTAPPTEADGSSPTSAARPSPPCSTGRLEVFYLEQTRHGRSSRELRRHDVDLRRTSTATRPSAGTRSTMSASTSRRRRGAGRCTSSTTRPIPRTTARSGLGPRGRHSTDPRGPTRARSVSNTIVPGKTLALGVVADDDVVRRVQHDDPGRSPAAVAPLGRRRLVGQLAFLAEVLYGDVSAPALFVVAGGYPTLAWFDSAWGGATLLRLDGRHGLLRSTAATAARRPVHWSSAASRGSTGERATSTAAATRCCCGPRGRRTPLGLQHPADAPPDVAAVGGERGQPHAPHGQPRDPRRGLRPPPSGQEALRGTLRGFVVALRSQHPAQSVTSHGTSAGDWILPTIRLDVPSGGSSPRGRGRRTVSAGGSPGADVCSTPTIRSCASSTCSRTSWGSSPRPTAAHRSCSAWSG